MTTLFVKLWAKCRPNAGQEEIDRLSPIMQLVPPQGPPVGLLARIEDELDRLQNQPLAQQSARSWQPRLMLPMGTAGMLVGAVGLAIAYWPAPPASCAPARLAVLQVAGTSAQIGIDTVECGRFLQLRHAGIEAGRGRALELWLIPHGTGEPHSLGLVAAKGDQTYLPVTIALMQGDTIAVSREPASGSPKAGPTGPVLAAAKIGKTG